MIKEKSPLFYNGNKYILLDKIYQHIPKNENGTFYDLFGGSGTMALNFSRLYKKALYNEYDPMVHKMFKWALTIDETALKALTKRILDLDAKYKFIIWGMNESELRSPDFDAQKLPEYKGWEAFLLGENLNRESDAELLWISSCYTFSNTLKFKADGTQHKSWGVRSFRDPKDYNFLKASSHKNIETRNGSFHDIDIDKIDPANDFVYLDPPYWNTDGNYNAGWTWEMEMELLKFCEKLNDRGIKWAMSNVFENKGKYNTHLKTWAIEKGWKVWTFDHKYTVNGSTGYAQEVLICNYEYAEDGLQLDLFGGMDL